MTKTKIDDRKMIGILLLIITITAAIFLTETIVESSMNYDSKSGHALEYFTNLSNIIVCIWFLLLSINILSSGKGMKIAANINIMASITTYILVTGIIYWLVLVPIMFSRGAGAWMFTPSKIWAHTTTPIVAVLMFIFVKSNKNIKNKKLKLHYFYIYPIVYITYGIIKATKGTYLYPMFNYELLGGWFGVAVSLIIIAIFFTAIYYIMVRGFKRNKKGGVNK